MVFINCLIGSGTKSLEVYLADVSEASVQGSTGCIVDPLGEVCGVRRGRGGGG